MTHFVKVFIEENIEDIEYLNYEPVIKGWYDIAYGSVDSDRVRIEELNEILDASNVATYRDTFNVRVQILKKRTRSSHEHLCN